MTPHELQALREKLVARRDDLIAEGDIALEPMRRDDAARVDDDEAPLTEMNQVIASRRNKNRSLELQRIEAAIRRIDDEPEDFGYCEECDEPIPIRRLEIKPWARCCVDCQEAKSPARGHRRRHAADYLD